MEKIILFCSQLSNHNYLLMEYVHLLGTAELLKAWNHIGHRHSYFHSIIIFMQYCFLAQLLKPSFVKIRHHQKEYIVI